jgi:cytochrome c oxidase assembly protein subunit 15
MAMPTSRPTSRSTTRAAASGSTAGRRRPSLVTVRRLALVSLVANIGIVATGGLVRLTNSGLGCPTWPRCESGDFVPAKALSWHGAIEFGNRMLTGVVLAAAVAVFVAAVRLRPPNRQIRGWAWVTLLGIPAQIVMGGLVTLSKLNPWVVAPHFLLSMLLIAASTVLWWRTRTLHAPGAPGSTRTASPPIPRLVQLMGAAIWGVTYLVFTVGTAVTGSGPHAGNATAVRLPFRPAAISQLHADLVMLLVGLAVSLAVYVSAVGASGLVRRTTRLLVAALGFQAAVGFAQYFSGLPVGLVELHVAGAAVVAAAVTAVVLALGDREQGPG